MTMQRWASCDTEKVTIQWHTLDHAPNYGDWSVRRRLWQRRYGGHFHLSRMVRRSEGVEKAICLLRAALNQYAGTHGFMYQTTWPTVWDREFQVLKQQGLEVAVIEEGDWLVATTLAFPGFKDVLEDYQWGS